MNRKYLFLMLFAFALFAVSCSDKKSGTARIQVQLTDAPADYAALYLDVQGVSINPNDREEGWQLLEGFTPGTINLLELTGGIEETIASDFLPAGYYSQIRLLLGENNTLVVRDAQGNETTHAIKVPSGSSSGLKLNLHQELIDGGVYNILFDFDVAKSVVEQGNGGYSLKPVIRMVVEASETGALKGKVTNTGVAGMVYLYKMTPDEEGAISAALATDGTFLLKGVVPGAYTLKVVPSAESKLQEMVISNVTVVKGMTTTMNDITLVLKP